MDQEIHELYLSLKSDFRDSKCSFQLNVLFIADSRTGFRSGLLWK